jgi:hypothetical protein
MKLALTPILTASFVAAYDYVVIGGGTAFVDVYFA